MDEIRKSVMVDHLDRQNRHVRHRIYFLTFGRQKTLRRIQWTRKTIFKSEIRRSIIINRSPFSISRALIPMFCTNRREPLLRKCESASNGIPCYTSRKRTESLPLKNFRRDLTTKFLKDDVQTGKFNRGIFEKFCYSLI